MKRVFGLRVFAALLICFTALFACVPRAAAAGAAGRAGDNIPVSRALAAKTLALAASAKSRIDALPRIIPFTDTKPSDWADRYINAVYTDGIMAGYGETFAPDAPLTAEQAQAVLERFAPGWGVKLELSGAANKPVSYRAWLDLFESAAAHKGVKFTEAEIVPLATPEVYPALANGAVITNIGPFGAAGYNLTPYLDTRVTVYARDGEIAAVLDGGADGAAALENVIVTRWSGDMMTLFVGGAERTYPVLEGTAAERRSGSEVHWGGPPFIADVVIKNRAVIGIKTYNDKIRGEVVKADSSSVTLPSGEYPVAGGAGIYSLSGGAAFLKSVSSLTVGADMADYYIYEGRIIAAVIDRRPAPEKIRALISVTGFTGYVHENVRLYCANGMTADGGAALREYNAPAAEAGKRVIITPEGGGKIRIDSVKRAWESGASPEYRGTIELIGVDGGWLVINELPIEEYVYAVVPSETPASFGLEALKVQAVTARSYAIAQISENRFARYGANVDDSTACQVYNNIPENELSIKAADETRGLCLTYEGEVVAANFFSTSAGVTANYGETWGAGSKPFPGESPVYLTSVKHYAGADYGDLSSEANARAFFKAEDVDCYDSGAPWFRWNVAMTAKQLAASINKNLSARYQANPARIKTWDGAAYVSKPVSSIGGLKGLEVLSRGEGGSVTKLKITGADATLIVETEYNVRALLAPETAVINRAGSSGAGGYALMPSAFFVIESEGDNYVFYGGGNGHGVGMSQNGVKGMVDRGYKFEEILRHYYKGAEITKM